VDTFRRSLTSLRETYVSVRPFLVEVLKRDRAMVAFGLAGVAVLSWTYLLLGINESPFCLWRDEPVMGRRDQRLCPAGEDYPSEPIGQPP
jgi:hypothetical protein